jgi:predicted extracellular nuclease
MIVGLLAVPGSAVATGSTTIAISEVYGGGGNAGAPYTNDFVELRNLGSGPVSLSGWSIQYASATGSSWGVTALPAVTLAAGQFFLVQEASGGANGAPLPTPDATGTTALAAGAGKVALVSSASALSGTCPSGLVDLVGYGGTASCFEGTGAAAAPSNTVSDQRAGHGLTDTNDNAADFQTAAPDPQNTSSPTAVTVSSFTAHRVAGAVVLRWSTGSEARLVGFHLCRGGVRLDRTLIPAGQHTYVWRDTAQSRRRHAYRLEAVFLDGRSIQVGAILG